MCSVCQGYGRWEGAWLWNPEDAQILPAWWWLTSIPHESGDNKRDKRFWPGDQYIYNKHCWALSIRVKTKSKDGEQVTTFPVCRGKCLHREVQVRILQRYSQLLRRLCGGLGEFLRLSLWPHEGDTLVPSGAKDGIWGHDFFFFKEKNN